MGFNFQNWKKSAIGRRIDVDHAYGDQCKDVDMDYVQAVFKKPYQQTIGYGNAKDVFNNSSSSYFQKIRNNPRDPKQIPRQGDIIVYGGYKGNPYGHTGVVDTADRGGVHIIEQDGFNPSGRTYETYRKYSSLPIIGWIRPKTSFVSKVVQKVKPKPTVKPAYYIIHKGDVVSRVAPHFGLSIARFKQLNPQIRDINKISVGQKVRVR